MVWIKNIKIDKSTESCNIYPEGSEESGTLTVNFASGEYQYTLPPGYEHCTLHASKARFLLQEMYEEKEKKAENYLLMWY